MGISGGQVLNEAEQALNKPEGFRRRPGLSDQRSEMEALISAEDEAKAMGDEYVSVEHLFLCLLREPNRGFKGAVPLYMPLTGTIFYRLFPPSAETSGWSATIQRLLMIP